MNTIPSRHLEHPDTLEEMQPLFSAIYHGSQAGQHQAAFDNVYVGRIRRGKEAYLNHKLGALGTNLSLLANFFETPWTRVVDTLSASDQSWVTGQAGYTLRAVGRLADAVEPMQSATEAVVARGDWRSAAACCNNLSEIHLTLGNIPEAIAAARQGVDFADRSADGFQKMARRATLANALHQSGDLPAAAQLFGEAERIEAERHPEHPILDSIFGYQYCDLLLGQGQPTEVLRRASETPPAGAAPTTGSSDIGLDHLSLARAHAVGSAEAAHHLDEAVDFLRRAGQLHYLPLGLLARGTPHDLSEVFHISTRSGMRLYLVDYHLSLGGNLEEAEALINETFYCHRRDSGDLPAGKASHFEPSLNLCRCAGQQGMISTNIATVSGPELELPCQLAASNK